MQAAINVTSSICIDFYDSVKYFLKHLYIYLNLMTTLQSHISVMGWYKASTAGT